MLRLITFAGGKMRIKTIGNKRINIQIIEFENNQYKSSKGITVYDSTIEEIYQLILKALKKETDR